VTSNTEKNRGRRTPFDFGSKTFFGDLRFRENHQMTAAPEVSKMHARLSSDYLGGFALCVRINLGTAPVSDAAVILPQHRSADHGIVPS
jgi:hypothetical protein